ncbi:MAG: peptidylprolyl isomerase [Anaerolineales bacterium]|nr:peptidylprolyl isomerase [Anaerolineales bacterium]
MAPKPTIQSKKHIARLERERRQVRLIKFIAIGVVAVVILILAYGYLDLNYLQARQPVAEINGEKITSKVFQARVMMQRNQLLNQYMQYLQYQQLFGLDMATQLDQIQASLDTPTVVGQQVLDALVDEALIRQEAKRRGISVTAEEVETFTREQFNFFPDGTPTPTITPTEVTITYPTLSPEQLKLVTVTPVPTEGPTSTPPPTATPDLSVTATVTSTPAPTSTPSPTATPYTLEGYQGRFDEALKGVKDIGLTENQYRQLFETELLRTKLFEAVTADTPMEDEQVWARHILVEDEATAKTILERLKSGEDFATLATELSQDTGSAVNGGDLGWFGKGQMVAEFETAAFALEDGEFSEPIQSNFGWHIIQKLGHTTVPLTASAYQQAKQTAFDEFIANLREESEVTTYDYWVERVPTSPNLQDLQQVQ